MNRRFYIREKGRWRLRILTAILIFVAFLFLIPIIFTICNSFMTENEIAANYGNIFAMAQEGKKPYISETVNLKFIPDQVTFSQN